MPEVHGPFEQSPSAAQTFPGGHVLPQLPPQSTSVSPAFFTPSEQVADLHVFALRNPPPEQTPLAQSPLPPHFFVSPHLPHVPPPQSTSVSAPFFAPSVQPLPPVAPPAPPAPPAPVDGAHTVPERW
jgi:hypothetical protein